jgi:hypothetical protein
MNITNKPRKTIKGRKLRGFGEERSPNMVKLKPTKYQREMVQVLAAVGWTNARICNVITWKVGKAHAPISEETLRKYFDQEIKNGRDRTESFTVGQLFKLIKEGHPASIFFFLKTRCGWREVPRDDDDIIAPPSRITVEYADASKRVTVIGDPPIDGSSKKVHQPNA